MNKKIFFLFVCTGILLPVFVFRQFIFGASYFAHDSITFMASHHLFLSSLFSGVIALWAPQLNCGQPLWALTEVFNVFDPAAVGVWCVNTLLGGDGMVAYQIVNLLWLMLFGLGAALCSRFITRDKWLNMAVFLLAAIGPLAEEAAAQSNFLYGFRYLPLLLWLFVVAYKEPSWRKSVLLGITAFCASGGYQTAYLAVYMGVFVCAFIAAEYLRGIRPPRGILRYFAAALGVLFIGILPEAVAGFKALGMVPATRKYFNFGWSADPSFFALTLADPLKTLLSWHGSFYLGAACACFAVVGLVRFARNIFSDTRRAGSFETALLVSSLILAVPAFGLLGLGAYFRQAHTFLTIRNWGFFVTPIMFSIIIFSVYGMREWLRDMRPREFFIAQAVFAVLVFVLLWPLDVGTLNFAPSGFIGFYARSRIFYKAFIVTAYLASACILFLLLKWLNGKNMASAGYLCAAAAALLIFSGRYFTDLNTYDRRAVKFTAENPRASALPQTRLWQPDLHPYLPFTPYVQVLRNMFTAASRPIVTAYGEPEHVEGFGYLLSQARQDFLVHSAMPENYLKNIMGVTAPIVRLVPAVHFTASEKQTLEFMETVPSEEFFNRCVIAETEDSRPLAGVPNLSLAEDYAKVRPAAQNVRVLSYSGSRALFEVGAASGAFLVFADNWDGGWRAKLDGAPCTLYRANYFAKAVYVPAGAHVVEFVYRPVAYLFAFWLRMVFCAACLLWLCREIVRLISRSH